MFSIFFPLLVCEQCISVRECGGERNPGVVQLSPPMSPSMSACQWARRSTVWTARTSCPEYPRGEPGLRRSGQRKPRGPNGCGSQLAGREGNVDLRLCRLQWNLGFQSGPKLPARIQKFWKGYFNVVMKTKLYQGWILLFQSVLRGWCIFLLCQPQTRYRFLPLIFESMYTMILGHTYWK